MEKCAICQEEVTKKTRRICGKCQEVTCNRTYCGTPATDAHDKPSWVCQNCIASAMELLVAEDA